MAEEGLQYSEKGDTLFKWCQQQGYLKAGGQQRTDSTYIIAAVASLHRLELVGQAFYRVL